MEDVVIRGNFTDNILKNVSFRNVMVVGIDSGNEFIDCTDCYKFIYDRN